MEKKSRTDTSAGRNYKANIAALLIYSGHVLGIRKIDWMDQGTHK